MQPWYPICTGPVPLVKPVPVDPSGRAGPTPNQARGPRWRRTSHGLYVPAAVDGRRPEQRILEASTLLPAHGAVTGWGSLRLARASYFDGLIAAGELPVELVAGPGHARRPRAGVVWSQDRLDPADVWTLYGIRCTRPPRAVFDEMRRRDLVDAVLAADMAMAAELLSIRRMRAYLEGRGGWTGVRRVLAALRLAEENSRSPGESRMRLAWVIDAGRPRPLANREVFSDSGRLLGIADLIDPDAGVVGEYDGGEHSRARRRSRDAARDSAFRDHGLEVFRVTGWDARTPGLVRDRIQAAYRRAGVSAMPRRWTLQPPPGWDVAPSLDDVLDLRDVMRELHEQSS